ncbi:hypothetical protein OIU74_002959 [Salix koriyanagi]|uniref:Pentatricopeptide repeat-containing protein n=1 Tax=Salix koriyanagi TaxID=2511006 RepID=A0A9Q0UXL0_9ROSI|nr:hypothetical protein OIU74_002959 [Salix koriyanagi]
MAFTSTLKYHTWFPFHHHHHHHPASHKPTSNSTLSFATTNHERLTTTTDPAIRLSPNFTPTQLLHSLRREEDSSAVIHLFYWASKQPNFKPSSSIYKEVLQKLGKAGEFDAMKDILKEMKISLSVIDNDSLLVFIESYASFGLYNEIIQFVDAMEVEFGVVANTHFYNFLLNVLVDGNKLKLVEISHSNMVSRGVRPDVSTFNILIKALCRAHQIRPAILLMEEMEDFGLLPDEKTFTTIMQGFIEEGNLDGAMRVKEQMVEAGCVVTNVTVNVLVNGFCKEGRIEEALRFIEEMSLREGFFPDKYTFNMLVNGLSKTGHVKHALEVMDMMLREGFDPDIYTYNSLISGLCKLGEVDKAIEVLNQMIERDCRVEVATKLLRTIQMKGITLTPHAYNPVIQALFRRKRSREAVRLFREMIEKAQAPDAVTYKIVFRGLCQGGGPIGEAVDFSMEMLERGYIPEFSSFYMLAEGLFSLARVGTLIKLIDMVMEKAKFSENEVTMIRGFLKTSKYQDALATLGGILDSRKPNRAYR